MIVGPPSVATNSVSKLSGTLIIWNSVRRNLGGMVFLCLQFAGPFDYVGQGEQPIRKVAPFNPVLVVISNVESQPNR